MTRYRIIIFFFQGTGNTVVKAVSVLKDHSVLEENIVLANLFCTPPATQTIVTAFPQVLICIIFN
jgi:uracil phosphoribosyltransferase